MPQLTDAELVTLAVMQALLGFTSEAGRPHPVVYGRSRQKSKRFEPAGWAEYGYCANRLSTRDGNVASTLVRLGAPGAIRTASARNRQRRELVVSATVEVARRRRRSGGVA